MAPHRLTTSREIGSTACAGLFSALAGICEWVQLISPIIALGVTLLSGVWLVLLIRGKLQERRDAKKE
jgi:hypothetical protein